MVFYCVKQESLKQQYIGTRFKMTEEIQYHKISFVCVLNETQKRNEGASLTDKSY